MLAFVVLILGVVFLVLWYSGMLQEIANRLAGRGAGASDAQTKTPRADAELERRLKVFEKFLAQSDEEEESPADD